MENSHDKKESEVLEEADNFSEDELLCTYGIDTLPPELFLLICTYLSPRFVITILSKVCKKFNSIIEHETTWKMRVTKRWPRTYLLLNEDSFSWKKACIESEEQHMLWTSTTPNYMDLYCLGTADLIPVDVVLFIENGQICASGSRDHNLKLWDVKSLGSSSEQNSKKCMKEVYAHKGWVWSMAYGNKVLYTGSWDGIVKSWDIEDDCNELESINLHSPVLCLSYNQNLLSAGTYNKQVVCIDPRASDRPVLKHNFHKKAVLCIAMNEKFIISGSEDRTLIIYDKVADKVLTSLKFKCYPTCLSHDSNQVWIGDSGGFIHMVDARQDKFEILQTFHSGHRYSITGIRHSLGSIITCSKDTTIRVLEPTVDPKPMAILQSPKDVAGITTFENFLASANCDGCVRVWKPNVSASFL